MSNEGVDELSEKLSDLGIKPFKTRRNFYLYDVYSNSILESDEKFWNVLKDFSSRGKIDQNYSKSSIKEAIQLIEELQKDDLLRPFTLRGFVTNSCLKEERIENSDSSFFHLTLNVNQKCNMRCKYCTYSSIYPGYRNYSDKVMSEDVAEKAVDIVEERSEREEDITLSFYGGEPLLNMCLIRKVVKQVEATVDKKTNFRITTNGLELDKALDFLMEKEFDIQVSLDGPKEIHNKWRKNKKGEGTFERVYGNLKEIEKKDEDFFKENVMINAVIAPPYPISEVKDFFENDPLLKKINVELNFMRETGCELSQVMNQMEKERYQNMREECKQSYIDEILRDKTDTLTRTFFEKKLIRIKNRDLKTISEKIIPNGICFPGNNRLFVDVDGSLHPCERVGDNLQIGDVSEGVKKNKVDKLIQRYKEISFEDCSDCWAVRLCRLCFAHSNDGDNLNKETKRDECKKEKNSLVESLQIYASILEKDEEALDFLNGEN